MHLVVATARRVVLIGRYVVDVTVRSFFMSIFGRHTCNLVMGCRRRRQKPSDSREAPIGRERGCAYDDEEDFHCMHQQLARY